MPKRKMTPARRAQIAQWQRKGQQSRKAKGANNIQRWSASELSTPRKPPKVLTKGWKEYRAPLGKTVLLYHNTTAARADAIVKERKWKTSVSPRNVYFRPASVKGNWEYYGKSTVAVRVPRKLLRLEAGGKSLVGYAESTYTVDKYKLTGRKVRRIK